MHAFVSARIDYCNSILYGIPDYHLNKLQRIQNAAARLVCEQSRYCHITPLLFNLHWLPVKFRIVFKILLITLKALKSLAPTYVNSLMYGLPNVQISKLQRVQNAVARLIINIPKFSHITPALYELHWLLIAYRIRFKI